MMKIVLLGDVMLGRLIDYQARFVAPGHFWGDTWDILRAADFSLINLECTLTASDEIWTKTPKAFHFRADPERALRELRAAGIALVNLANNHILDFDVRGLRDTLNALRHAGIGYCGAGENAAQAQEVKFVEFQGARLGILGLTDNTPEWAATEEQPGVHYTEISRDNALHLSPTIAAARTQCDLLIASLHWGPNWAERPTPAFIDFAHTLIDAGTDIIHGHSAHIFQGIEIYRAKPIFYNCGDFLDDYAVDPALRNDRGFLYQVHVQANQIIRLELYPALNQHLQVNRAKGKDFADSIDRMTALSRELGTPLEQNTEGLFLNL